MSVFGPRNPSSPTFPTGGIFSSPSPTFPGAGGINPAASTSAGFSMDPATAMLLASLGKGTFEALLGRSGQKSQEALTREQLAQQRDQFALAQGLSTAGLAPAEERQKMALLHAMLSGARPPSITPPSHIAGSMPKVQAAFQIPEGGFSPETLAFTSPESLYAQEATSQANLSKFSPNYQPPAMNRVGYQTPNYALERAIRGRIRPEDAESLGGARPRRA